MSFAVAMVVLSWVGFACSGAATGPIAPRPPLGASTVEVTPPTTALSVGATVQMVAEFLDSSGQAVSGGTVQWTSSDSSVATVNRSGVVTGIANGSASIIATSGQLIDSAVVTIMPPSGSPINHVMLLVLENHDATSVIGNSAAPYLNSLAQRYALATQYYANTHPSIGNYFMLTVGDTISNNDGYGGTISEDNVVRELLAAHKTWKSYAEDLPSVGYMGNVSGNYARYHNPLTFFTDVANNATQRNNLVPFTQLASDVAANALPNYALIIPNLCDDAHSCSLATADSWLKTNIDPVITSAAFQRDALLIITFDESEKTSLHGGGRVPWIIVGAMVKHGYQSSTLYQHQSTLRLMLARLGVTMFPNHAATAPDMSEFFTP